MLRKISGIGLASNENYYDATTTFCKKFHSPGDHNQQLNVNVTVQRVLRNIILALAPWQLMTSNSEFTYVNGNTVTP